MISCQMAKQVPTLQGLRHIFKLSDVVNIQTDHLIIGAGLAWLLHMSLYGEFVRVPETLCFKYYKSESLSRSWKFDQQSKIDALASCMRELWTADIPTNSKVRIAIPLMKTMMHQGIQR